MIKKILKWIGRTLVNAAREQVERIIDDKIHGGSDAGSGQGSAPSGLPPSAPSAPSVPVGLEPAARRTPVPRPRRSTSPRPTDGG